MLKKNRVKIHFITINKAILLKLIKDQMNDLLYFKHYNYKK